MFDIHRQFFSSVAAGLPSGLLLHELSTNFYSAYSWEEGRTEPNTVQCTLYKISPRNSVKYKQKGPTKNFSLKRFAYILQTFIDEVKKNKHIGRDEK